MSVKAILELKGRNVVTLSPGETVGAAARVLAKHKIGALIVVDGDGHIAGILSERDIVRAVGTTGADALDKPVASLMTARVQVCREDHSINEVMGIMTKGRFRHLPVETSGRLAGIISIGDVVKRRIQMVEREAEEIRNYISSA